MRAIVCGGRNFRDREFVFSMLSRLDPSAICHGGANGADRDAHYWALKYGVPVTVYTAMWDRDGNAAGPIRNRRMLDEFCPDVVIAFPGGRGTEHMKRIAAEAGIEVIEAHPVSA